MSDAFLVFTSVMVPLAITVFAIFSTFGLWLIGLVTFSNWLFS